MFYSALLLFKLSALPGTTKSQLTWQPKILQSWVTNKDCDDPSVYTKHMVHVFCVHNIQQWCLIKEGKHKQIHSLWIHRIHNIQHEINSEYNMKLTARIQHRETRPGESHCTNHALELDYKWLVIVPKWTYFYTYKSGYHISNSTDYLAHFFLSSLFEHSTKSNHMVCFDFGQWASNSTVVQ